MPEGAMRDGRGTRDFDAVVIGAGFSGLYLLHLLRDRLGLSVRVLERAEGVGGTWWWNRYPGARCDSESHGYAYFFSREIHEAWSWSERYPGHAEIRRYLNFVADRLDLKRDIRFGTEVTGAEWDETSGAWAVRTDAGETLRATYLVTATGCLSSANLPRIPGRDDFAGEAYHTGQWPHEGVDFSGKRVGQIGTGSTGIQAAPVIAETAGHLAVFQRTANYSVPARNHPLSEDRKREIRDGYDEIKALLHQTANGHPFDISQRKAFDVDEAERRRLYEKSWEVGGLRFRRVFADLLVDKTANDTAAEFLKDKIREIVADPETAEDLADIDHPYAAKRPPIDTHYFETFNRPNVTLVNLRKDPIKRIVPEGVELESGKVHELDVLVFATGFDAMTGPLIRLNLTGKDGLTLAEAWKAGPRTWLGLAVPGFPNLFTVTGPGSPSVLTNMPVAIEQHCEWIAGSIAMMNERGLTRIEATPEAAEAWIRHVNDAADATLLPQAGHSWYLGANVPGKPRVFMPYAGGMPRYREICRRVVEGGYEGFRLGGGEAAPVGDFVSATAPGV